MKSRYWLLAFLIIIAVCVIAWVCIGNAGDDSIVVIYQDGKLLREIDLSKVTEPYSFTVEYKGSKNVIQVEPGDIYVVEADCPDNVCVKHGSLGHRTPIVCLPNRLVIKWKSGGTELDAVI